jgi:hypothetical protein
MTCAMVRMSDAAGNEWLDRQRDAGSLRSIADRLDRSSSTVSQEVNAVPS